MFDEPVMLISGARKGIGQHLARYFAEKGYRVVGCSREVPTWEMDRFEHMTVDVGDEEQVCKLIGHIRRRYGRLDVALNNAGIASMNHSLLTPATVVERIMRTNVTGTFLVCRESARLMAKRHWGRIVNFSTVAVPLLLEGEAVYAASKSAVEMLTRILAYEFASLGITVNAVGPMPVETDLIRTVPREEISNILDRLAIKRLGAFEDIAHVIDFLIHEKSGYVTGQTIYLGGASC